MTNSDEFLAQLAVIREQFVKQLVVTLDELAECVKNLDFTQLPKLAELHATLHKLTGSGGTFGFTELSKQSRILEETVKAWLDGNREPSTEEWEAWKTGLLNLPKSIIHDESKTPVDNEYSLFSPSRQRDFIRIILIEDEQHFGEELGNGLGQFGYEVVQCTDFPAAELAIRDDTPDIMLVDIMLSQCNGTEEIPLLFKRLGYRIPTIFLTARSNFLARLAAAQAGGDAFLVKPVDCATLAGRIEMILRDQNHPPYRVLIVDDDEVLASHYQLTLEAAGMVVEKICRPRDTLAALENLHPDILILDLYMPDCNGSDLALAIRYQDAWMGLPIIYLSAEEDLDVQIKALKNGGDDFLTKPISDVRLVATVQARAARARKVSELMSQDSLTGLLKHSNIKERMAQEFERSHRQNEIMAMAMVDMDHFKKVNDTWGHPMGDQVIKSLAQLLRQRLRRQDSIGRYGGEEFAVILPDCSADDAVHLLDDIRKRFSEIHFKHEGQTFSITLSAGVADNEQYTDAQSMLMAADAALYFAKNNGRNQIRPYKDVIEAS